MFIANHWKDYEVIDTSGGEKLNVGENICSSDRIRR